MREGGGEGLEWEARQGAFTGFGYGYEGRGVCCVWSGMV